MLCGHRLKTKCSVVTGWKLNLTLLTRRESHWRARDGWVCPFIYPLHLTWKISATDEMKEVCSSGEEHSIGGKQVIGSNRSVTVKGKAVPVLNKLSDMQWWRMRKWRYSSTILDLDTRCRWAVSCTPLSLYDRETIPRYPLDRTLGGPKTCQDDVETRKILHFRKSNPGRPARNPSLYRLNSRVPKFNLIIWVSHTVYHLCSILRRL
jgi:hypothetical protein